MPIMIRFTPEEIRRAKDPLEAEITTVAIENALDCDGWRCGWCRSQGDEVPPPPHFHLVIRADGGRAGERIRPVFLEE